ncbi:ester cyclase [Candidatus Amarolinea dominans]|uniref:ester cyclase n=1 Tax=Candidatus Amarolinea dominans TaxID=3140696 RepID=UPI0031CC9D18
MYATLQRGSCRLHDQCARAAGSRGLQTARLCLLPGLPTFTETVLEQFEDGNKVVSRVAWSGTHTGTLNGIPPTGRSFQNESIVIDTVVNGKIAERREVSDMLGMLQQLGLIPG